MADVCDTSSAETEILNAIEYVKSVRKKKENIHKYMIKHNSDVNEELLKRLIEHLEEKEVIKIVVMIRNLTIIEQSKIRVDNIQ